MDIKLALPEAADLDRSAVGMLAIAQKFVIDSPVMYNAAGDELKSISSSIKTIEAQRVAITKPLTDAHKAVMDLFRRPLELREQAVALLKGSMMTYQRAEATKAAEQQRLVDETARVERERLAAEARVQQEESARQAKVASDAADAVSAAEQTRKDAEAAGDREAAAAAQALADEETRKQVAAQAASIEAHAMSASIEMTAAVTTAPTVISMAPKVSGISVAKTWKARITDKAALLAYIAAHPECLDWVEVKMAPLNGMAKALKNNMKIPGVEAFPEETMSARAA